jgi:AraC-like DNA-binding protein
LIGRTGEAGRAFLAASGGGRRLREATEARLGEPVTFALGGLKPTPEGLPASFAEAREALASVFGAGEGGLVAFGDIASRERREATRDAANATAEDAVAVVAAVKLGSPAGAAEAARLFVTSLSGRKASEEHVKSKVVACLAAIDSSFPSEAERPSPPLVATAAASNLGELAELAAGYASSCAAAVERARAGRAADLVERARIIVERRMADEELSLDDVAAELFVSPSHLRHVFKKQAGTTFCDYLCALRLDAAARLLDDRDLKIQDIAARVGYAEQRYFASCFKKRFGMTPTERRSANRVPEKE